MFFMEGQNSQIVPVKRQFTYLQLNYSMPNKGLQDFPEQF